MIFSFTVTIIFLLYLIFWIQIPGMLLEHFLLPARIKRSSKLLAGFFIGFIFLATIYLIESFTGVDGLITITGPLFSAIGFITHLNKQDKKYRIALGYSTGVWAIVFCFIFIASVVNFQLKYNMALSGQTTQVYHDYLFHTGNIVSLSRSFPNNDIRVDGLTFYYHYFYELVFAMCKHIFKLDAFSLYVNGNALMSAWPLSLALVTLGTRIKGRSDCRKRNYFFYCFGIFMSCICIMPLNIVGVKLPFSWANNHFYGNPNALGVSLSLSILVIDILVDLWNEKVAIRRLVVMYLLAAAATGFKGTTGALLVAIAWSVFIIQLIIERKFYLQRLLYPIVMTLGFVLTYLVVTVGVHSSGANNRAMEITPAGTLEASRIGQIITKLGLDYMSFPWVVIAVIISAICIVGPCILAFVGFTVDKCKVLFKDGKIGDIFDWFAIGSVIMGVIGFETFSVPGLSQGYFIITNAGFIYYCAVKYIIAHQKNIISTITKTFFVIGCLFIVVDLAYFCYDDVKQNTVFNTPANSEANLVSADTMEAYLWLRDNTEEDAKVAVDRLSEELDYRSIYFYCSAFAERQCFLEGYDYSDVTEKQVDAMKTINEKFFSDNSAEAELAMEMNGIDYLVVTEMMHPGYEPSGLKLKLVFKNDEVSIYRFYSNGGMTAVDYD